jgi:hypothetical protein
MSDVLHFRRMERAATSQPIAGEGGPRVDTNFKLLILESEEPPEERRLAFRGARSRALNAISSLGGKVRHDSGGRLLVIEVPGEVEKALAQHLPGARVVPVDADVIGSFPNLDSTEELFLDALKIRTSKSYREAKRRRKVGETPEEQQLVSGPDVREEY